MVGAVGGMGRWIVEKILSRETWIHLTLADVDGSVRDVAEKLSLRTERAINGRPISFPGDEVAGIDPSSFDVILLAVPTEQIPLISRTIVSRARPEALVIDIASTKADPLTQILAAAPPGVSVIGSHPMFGPRVESLVGETVVLCETDRTDPRHLEAVKSLIERYGGTVQNLAPEKHDQLMLVVQGLAHFVHLALGATFRQRGWDLRDALQIQTPPFRSAASILGRLINLSGERQAQLYASIQQAPGSSELRKEFVAAAVELDRQFDEASPSASQEAIEEIARHFPPSAIDQLSAQSDEAVRARQAVEVELQRLKEEEEVCGFESREGEITIGRVVDFDAAAITLAGAIVEGHGKTAAIYDEESQGAARLHGIAGLPKNQRLQRRGYRLLRPEELQRWREATLDSHQIDVTPEIPRIANVAAVCRYLVALIPEILSAEVTDTHNPADPTVARKVTFRLRIVGDRDPDRVASAVVEFVENIGGEAPRLFGSRRRGDSLLDSPA